LFISIAGYGLILAGDAEYGRQLTKAALRSQGRAE